MAVAVAAACGTRYPLGPLRGLTVHSPNGLLFCSYFPPWTVLYTCLFLDGSSLLHCSFTTVPFLTFSSVDCSLTAPTLRDCSCIYAACPYLTVLSLHHFVVRDDHVTLCMQGRVRATSQSACIPPAVRNTTDPWAKTAQSTPGPSL